MEAIEYEHKAVRDLKVYGTPVEIETLIAHIERQLDADWFRAHEAEEEFRRRTGHVQWVFIRASSDDREGVAIELRATPFGLEVFSVVPERTTFSIDNYNAVVVEFYLRYLDPAALDLELMVEISPDEICAKRGHRHSAVIASW